MTSLSNSVVFVTGANGGLGKEFVTQTIQRGASKVYASTRRTHEWNDDRIVPLIVDVTDENSVRAAVKTASDTTIVINNAGTNQPVDSILGDTFDEIRAMFETNFFGAVRVVREFAPVLASNGGGALLDVHSVLSWLGTGAYSASKSAFWSATNSIRLELASQRTHVMGLHLGYTDTSMIANLDVEKNDPAVVVSDALDGLEADAYEVLADEITANIKAGLSGPIEDLYTALPRR